MESLITVVVPVYNTEQYLEECVSSLLAQTYRNLEIILVDDGSTDASGALCDEFAARDGRVRVIRQKNGGLSAARNAGMDAARGRFLGFVDSDDMVAPQMYERLYNALITTGADISMCSPHNFTDGEAIAEPVSGDTRILTAYEALSRVLGPQGAEFNYAWNKLYSINISEGIRFPKGKLNEDAFVAYRLLYRSKKIAVIPDRLYYYRTRAGSITHSDNYALSTDIYEVVAARTALFEAEGWADLVRASKREMLDWHIHRHLMGRKSPNRNSAAWRRRVVSYRSYYKKYRAQAPGLKYALFYASPVLYGLLSDFKKKFTKAG